MMLSDLAGTWTATYKLYLAPPTSVDSPSTATVTPLLDGRFVRIDYTWSHDGKPIAGSLLVGHEQSTGVVTVAWMDSFHNGDRLMISTGIATDDGGVDVRGTYPAPPGPDWSWRTEIRPTGDRWSMVMFNVFPDDGHEELAVDAHFSR